MGLSQCRKSVHCQGEVQRKFTRPTQSRECEPTRQDESPLLNEVRLDLVFRAALKGMEYVIESGCLRLARCARILAEDETETHTETLLPDSTGDNQYARNINERMPELESGDGIPNPRLIA